MDSKYGGLSDYKQFLLSNFYKNIEKNIYVFGGNDNRYRVRMLCKHIESLYNQKVPTVVFYQEPSNSEKEVTQSILYLKNKLKDQRNRILLVDRQYPFYHPLLGISKDELVNVIDPDDTLLRDEIAYLDAVVTLMELENVPIKLHSLSTYIKYDLKTLIEKCDYHLKQRRNNYIKDDILEIKKIFEEEQVTGLSSSMIKKKLNELNFPIVDLENRQCHCSLTNAMRNNQIICINLAGNTEKMMRYFQAEMNAASLDYQIILFDVNCSLCEEFEKKVVNEDKLSIYSSNFNHDFSDDYQQSILGKDNVTLLFKMQAGNASSIVDYYGQHDITYHLRDKGETYRVFDFLHLGPRHTGYHEHQETVNRLSGEHVSRLENNFECFEVEDNVIIYHTNVCYDNLL